MPLQSGKEAGSQKGFCSRMVVFERELVSGKKSFPDCINMKQHHFLIPESQVLQIIKEMALRRYTKKKGGEKKDEKSKNRKH